MSFSLSLRSSNAGLDVRLFHSVHAFRFGVRVFVTTALCVRMVEAMEYRRRIRWVRDVEQRRTYWIVDVHWSHLVCSTASKMLLSFVACVRHKYVCLLWWPENITIGERPSELLVEFRSLSCQDVNFTHFVYDFCLRLVQPNISK